MPPIKSINASRTVLPSDRPPAQPKIFTSAIPDPPKPTTTLFTPERIVGMTLFHERLYVATENGVYEKDTVDGIFKRLKFEIVEEPSE